MTPLSAESSALEDGELLAAIDIGSNSYHMVVARYVLGQLRIVDRLRETVRMAGGLDGQGGLDSTALARALDCLARFGERIRTMPPHRVRAIATNTVRAL
ncbi:MAG: exopolyphosphatase, partial [Rhodanobacter sp.]